MPSNRGRGKRHELKHRELQLNMRKNFLSVSMTEHWNRLSTEVVESAAQEIFKSHLDMMFCNLLSVNLLYQGGWT